MQYRLDKNYPEPMVERPNLEYARLLKEDYCGVISETTAVMLYTYQHITSSKQLEEFSDMMHNISIVEMYHLDLLGETIILLGDKADYNIRNYQNDTSIPWTTSFVPTATDLKRMLEININGELAAIEQYQNHLVQINDHYIQNLLLRIIEDEKIHVKLFTEFYERYFGNDSKV